MRKFINLIALAALLFVPWVAKAQCTDGTPCQFTIAGEDSYGDGWEGSLTIYRNNVQMATFTVASSTNTQTFTVCQGDLIRIDWSGQDQYYENTFTITGGDGTVYISNGQGYTFAPSGTVVEFAACPTCIPPSNLTATGITSDGLTLNWVDTSNSGASYSIDYWTGNGDTNTVYATTTTYTFTGLDANTGYHFAVKVICSASDESTALTGFFGTACGSSTCEITVTATAQYASWGSYYTPSAIISQNGIELATVQGTQQVSVCSSDSVVVTYVAPSYTYGFSSVTVVDGGGTTVYTGTTTSNSTGDVLTTIATPCPSCIPPTALFVDSVDQNNITIGWTPRSGATQFAVYIADSLISESVTDTFYTFTGLSANTPYTLGVQSICGVGDTSSIVTLSRRTSCGAMGIPFFVDFEDAAYNGAWYPCWDSTIHAGTDPSVNDQPGGSYNPTQHTSGGLYAMYLQGNSSENYNLVVGPEMNITGPINVSFWAIINNGWIKAGVITNPRDTTTFIPLVTITSGGWTEYEFNTSALTLTGNYRIAWLANGSGYIGKFDDVSVTEYSGCARPAAATVGTVSARQVELSWESVTGAAGYTVYYGTVNDPTSSSLQTEPSSDTSFTLTGLQPETHYYAWVATNCGGTESDLRYAGSFTTLVSCPHVNDLAVDTTFSDGATVSWHTGDQETQWLIALDSNDYDLTYDSTYTFTGLDAMTGHTVYVRAYCGLDDTSSAQSVNFATACTDATCNLTVEMTDSYGDGWNNGAVNIYQAGVQVATATLSSGNNGTATIEVCSSAAVEVRVTSGSYPSEMSFVVRDGSGSPVYTAAQGTITASSNGSLLATIASPCPECIMPMGLAVDTVTATEATIHWVAQDGQSSWFVVLDSNEAVTVTDTFYTFYGLNARTAYTAHVATDCSGDTSSFASIAFTTDCATGSCNITVDMVDSWGDGWNGAGINFYQNGALAGTATLTSSSTGTALVNVCSGIPVSFSWQSGSYDSECSYVIHDGGMGEIYNSATSGVDHSDSIENACPTCMTPTGVMATAVDSNSIAFTWDVNDTVYGYLVSFDGGPYTYSATGYESYSGLLPNTEHTFSVKALCTATDTSNAATITLSTTCGPMAMPFVESFESGTAGSTPLCWNVISGDPEIDNYSNAHTGTNSLSMNGTDMIATALVPLDGDSLHVSFWARHSGGTLEAGVMTNPLFDTTFIPLVTSNGNGDVYTLYEFNTLTLDHFTHYYVAFRYNAPYNYVYIDDINIRVDDGCLYPSNLVVSSTAASTTLLWSDGTGSGSFVIEYRESGDSWGTPIAVYDTTYTLLGLNASTQYEVRVGFLCGNDTLWTSATFQTPCGLMAVPYFEDFDSYANDVMPPCWGWSSVSATHWDGGVFFRSYHGGGSEYVVVPELNGNITKLKVEFDTKVGTIAENDGILIGVANSAGTLIAWLDTIQDPNFSRNNHVHKTIYFTNYTIPSGAARVAFAQYRNWNEWALIDNINIEVLPECYPVDNLTGHNLIDPENTTFTWTPIGSAGQWQVYVDTVTVGLDSVETLPASAFTTVYDTSYTIPIGLIQGGGIYNIFVRSNCGSEQSNWVMTTFGAGTVIMDQASDTVVGCGFVVYDNGGPIAGYLANTNTSLILRSENVGSQLEVFGGIFGFGMDPATLTIYDGEGTSGTVLYTYNTVNGRDTLTSVLATSTTGALTITFSVNGTMCHTGYELYIHCTGVAACPRPTELNGEMTSDTTATVTWNGSAPSYHFYHRLAPSGSWTRQTVATNSITLTGLLPDTVYDMYVVALCSATDSSTASVVRQLNTHRGDTPTPCPAPLAPTASNITMNSAVIAWTATGSESTWHLEVIDNATLSSQTLTLTTNPYTLTGLTPATSYTVRVQAVCGPTSESTWSNALVFSTAEEDTSAVYYTVSVSCNPNMGTVTGGGTYREGDTVTLTATSRPGYHFLMWSDGNTDSIRTLVVRADVNLIAQFESNSTGIQDVENGTWNVDIYPNPASSTATLTGIDGKAVVTIVDINGRRVSTQAIKQSGNQTVTIDVSSLASGTYFVRITGSESILVRKLIVK